MQDIQVINQNNALAALRNYQCQGDFPRYIILSHSPVGYEATVYTVATYNWKTASYEFQDAIHQPTHHEAVGAALQLYEAS